MIVMETEKLVVGVKCKNDGTSAKPLKNTKRTKLKLCRLVVLTELKNYVLRTQDRGGASNHRPFVDMGAAVSEYGIATNQHRGGPVRKADSNLPHVPSSTPDLLL